MTSVRHIDSAVPDKDELVRAIAESARDGIVLMDAAGCISFWNPAAERLFGYSRDEALGKDLHQLIAPERYHAAFRAGLARLLETGRAEAVNRTVEIVGRRRDGLEVPIELSLSVLRVRDTWQALGIVRDMSERKETEKHVQLLSAMLDEAPAGIIVHDAEARLLYANQSAAALHGTTVEEASRASLRDFLGADEVARLPARIEAIFAAGEASFEVQHQRRDGTQIPLHVRARTVRWHDQQAILSVQTDLTALKRADDELREANAQLEAATARANTMAAQAELASAAKSEFLANMSHEIRTPMNGVIGMAGLLLDTDLTPEQRQYAETVRTSAEALLALINDILDFSKIEAHKLSLERVDFDPRLLLDELLGMMKVRADEKRLALACQVEPRVPAQLRGDAGRLRQILMNLLGNALKFTSRGAVAVEVTVDEETADDLVLRFCVRDTGIGIPRDKVPLLFTKFSQVDASTTRQYGGTGLGLAISKELAELLGGAIGVDSEVGRGSEFWFTVRLLRLAECAPVRDAPAAIPPPRWQQVRLRANAKVLLAEDTAINQRVALAILRKLGLEADVVGTGRAAVQALGRVAYDLVLMDVQMPEMDGLEATKAIRADGHVLNPRVPIVAMTAHAMATDRAACLEAGMDDYMAKPIRPAAVAELLQKWLPAVDAAPVVPPVPVGPVAVSPQPPTPQPATPLPATPLPGPAPVVFDEAALLERVMDDRDLARVIASGFLADVPKQVARLEAHLGAGDVKGAERQAHALKGAAGVVGGDALMAASAALERKGKAGDLDGARRALVEVQRQFEALKSAMHVSSVFSFVKSEGA